MSTDRPRSGRALFTCGCVIVGAALGLAALCTYLRHDEYLVLVMSWCF